MTNARNCLSPPHLHFWPSHHLKKTIKMCLVLARMKKCSGSGNSALLRVLVEPGTVAGSYGQRPCLAHALPHTCGCTLRCLPCPCPALSWAGAFHLDRVPLILHCMSLVTFAVCFFLVGLFFCCCCWVFF